MNMNVRAIDGSRLRIDITSPTGTHLGSLLVVDSDMQYMNVSERTLIKAKTDRAALQSMIRVPLEASLLFNLLFDRAPTQKNWTCSSDNQGQLKACTDMKAGIQINWVRRERDQRTIEIDHVSANLQMSLFGFGPNVPNPDKAFDMKIPASFKIKQL